MVLIRHYRKKLQSCPASGECCGICSIFRTRARCIAFDSPVMTNDWTTSSIRGVETPQQVARRRDRVQGALGAAAPLEERLGEVCAGPQLGDGYVQGSRAAVQVAVAVPVALGGAGLAELPPTGPAHAVGVSGQRRVDERREQLAHQVRSRTGPAAHAQSRRGQYLTEQSSRLILFGLALDGHSKDHAVTTPRLRRHRHRATGTPLCRTQLPRHSVLRSGARELNLGCTREDARLLGRPGIQVATARSVSRSLISWGSMTSILSV